MSTSCAAPGRRTPDSAACVGEAVNASGSRMSAPSPRPNAFLATGDYLLRKLDVGLGAFTMNVVEDDGLPVARRLRQSNIPRDYRLEYLRAEEAPKIGRHLP